MNTKTKYLTGGTRQGERGCEPAQAGGKKELAPLLDSLQSFANSLLELTLPSGTLDEALSPAALSR